LPALRAIDFSLQVRARRIDTRGLQPQRLGLRIIGAKSHDVHARMTSEGLGNPALVQRLVDHRQEFEVAFVQHRAAVRRTAQLDGLADAVAAGVLRRCRQPETQALVHLGQFVQLVTEDADVIEPQHLDLRRSIR